jgi:hypothetical protein
VSPTNKICRVIENTDVKFHLKSVGKAVGIPFSDTFSVEEDLIVLSVSGNAGCSVMRVLQHVIWHKSTIMKGKIYSSSVSAGKGFWTEYGEWIKKKGVNFKERKAPQKVGNLKHGIEKSNKLFEK